MHRLRDLGRAFERSEEIGRLHHHRSRRGIERGFEAGEVKLIAIGVTVMVAEVDWLGSLMLVAVSVAVVWDPITLVGAL